MRINKKVFDIIYTIVFMLMVTSILWEYKSIDKVTNLPNIYVTFVAMFFFGMHMGLKIVNDFIKEE